MLQPRALLLLFFLPWCSACREASGEPAATGQVNFTVENRAGSQALALDTGTYTTAGGESFTVSTFEYYLSNLKLTKSDGTVYAAPGIYHLVDQARPASLRFTVPAVPAGTYAGVSFVVGVDSAATAADPLELTADLNPANNMYWTWNSGHIFLKLEGLLTSTSPARPLICHVGGYARPYRALVTARPSFDGHKLRVGAGQSAGIVLKANVLRMFDGPARITLSTYPGAHMPSASAVQVAHNYGAGMFSVGQLTAD